MACTVIHPKSGNVLLENNVNGKIIRLSTGKKATSKLIGWYKAHIEDEFWKLYYQKNQEADQRMAFSEYARYIVDITQSNRNEFSQRGEIKKVERLIKYFGDMALEDIKPSTIQAWQDTYLKTLAPKTVKEYRSTLSVILKFAYNDDLIRKNPLSPVKSPKLPRRVVDIFSNEERDLLLEHSNGQLHNLIQFAFYSGLRAGEIIGLKWENVDLYLNKINVCMRVRKGTIDLPKGDKIRLIDLLPQAKEALLVQRQLTGLSTYIFHSKEGKPYFSETSITQSIQELCKKIGIESGGGLQKMRRTHNTMLKQCGLPLDWILHQMGHETDEVNRNHYTGTITVDVSKIIA
ncbi:tyrosine-type recombinase/integrase [Sulfurospirillum sp. hDNRA2]|uniref:tyrosine-type recombinase/integrase n=1 Tax=Sulfurospirillum TaxID=57665 RepID=UPI0020B693FF|nr:site-specific integrase [Sulfurospirillum sp. DNRA8]MCR1809973.1 site-specific integrase [Sulfurospirillum sp. DNRA8]